MQFNIASLGPACRAMGQEIRKAAIELRELGLSAAESRGPTAANL